MSSNRSPTSVHSKVNRLKANQFVSNLFKNHIQLKLFAYIYFIFHTQFNKWIKSMNNPSYLYIKLFSYKI